MILIRLFAAVFAVALFLVCTAATAAPLRCSDEEKACIVICAQANDPRKPSSCITNCQARQAICRQTGCWDNGAQRYCGLLRQ